MRIIMFVFMALALSEAQSQVLVDGKDINTLPIQYCDITIFFKLSESRYTVLVDYGQVTNSGSRIEKPDGKVALFKSHIDALNFMYQNGWELVLAYEKSSDTKYLLKRIKQPD